MAQVPDSWRPVWLGTGHWALACLFISASRHGLDGCLKREQPSYVQVAAQRVPGLPGRDGGEAGAAGGRCDGPDHPAPAPEHGRNEEEKRCPRQRAALHLRDGIGGRELAEAVFFKPLGPRGMFLAKGFRRVCCRQDRRVSSRFGLHAMCSLDGFGSMEMGRQLETSTLVRSPGLNFELWVASCGLRPWATFDQTDWLLVVLFDFLIHTRRVGTMALPYMSSALPDCTRLMSSNSDILDRLCGNFWASRIRNAAIYI